jgi:hypothetical protein
VVVAVKRRWQRGLQSAQGELAARCGDGDFGEYDSTARSRPKRTARARPYAYLEDGSETTSQRGSRCVVLGGNRLLSR